MKALDKIQFNEKGLVPVITQDFSSSEVLMMAWMNKEALSLSVKTKKAVYFSRSRKKLWFKGEESGHSQDIVEIYTDCDQDVILLKVSRKVVLLVIQAVLIVFLIDLKTINGKASQRL